MVHDGTMYVTASYSRLFALDASTGEKQWQYDAPPARRHHAVLRRGQPRRRALRQPGRSSRTLDAQLVALEPGHRQGRSGRRRSTTIEAGYSTTAAPIDRQRPDAHRRFRRRVRRGRPRRGARCRRPASWSGSGPTVEGHMGYTTTPTAAEGERHDRHDQRRAGRATCGRPAAAPPGSAAPTTRRPASPSSAPATRRPGTATCARATTSSRPPRVAIDREDRRDQVALPDHAATTAGTSTASTSSSPSTWTARRVGGKADRNGFFFVIDRTNGKLLNAVPVRRARSPGPRAST